MSSPSDALKDSYISKVADAFYSADDVGCS
jgi:hypothetical protein